MAGHYVLKRSGSQFMFNLKAANNETILTSERYEAKAGAENGIASVRQNAPHDVRYSRLTASDGQFYFVLKAANAETLGTSERYSSTAGMENGITSVKTNAPGAPVRDET